MVCENCTIASLIQSPATSSLRFVDLITVQYLSMTDVFFEYRPIEVY
jgi:hypothetical protein